MFISCAALSCSNPDNQAISSAVTPSEKNQIEQAIISVVTFKGEEDERLTLPERQTELGIPITSVAIAKNWDIHWAKAYGETANTDTRLQAASLSKTIASVGLITLAEDLGISLDDDLSKELKDFGIATLNPESFPITLRGLLSHTNGATVSGFRGYAVGSNLPDSRQIVSGVSPANSKPVTIMPNPQAERRYSGGGYQIAQLWAETITEESFEQLMQRLVLKPIGMTNSSFTVVEPDAVKSANYAQAFDGYGAVIGGGWYLHPEQAAAGLWTTPSDYTKFVLHLMGAAQGRDDSAIRPSVAKEVLTPVINETGMGLGIQTRQGEIRLMKSGLNQGFICTFMAFPERGDVIVTMTNSKSGFPMIGDVNRTANQAYGWPSSPLIVHDRLSVNENELFQLAGDYSVKGDTNIAFSLTHDGSTLIGTTPSGYRFDLVKIGENQFVDPADAEIATFSKGTDERLQISSGEEIYMRINSSD